MKVEELAKQLWFAKFKAYNSSVEKIFTAEEIGVIWSGQIQEEYIIQARHILDNLVGRVDAEEIQKALARGYCHEANTQKVVDPELIIDMTAEVIQLPVTLHWKGEKGA